MPGILTRIKVICPVWLAIKWLVIVMIVSRSGDRGGDYGRYVQKPPLGDDWATITGAFGIDMASTDCGVCIEPDTLVRGI